MTLSSTEGPRQDRPAGDPFGNFKLPEVWLGISGPSPETKTAYGKSPPPSWGGRFSTGSARAYTVRPAGRRDRPPAPVESGQLHADLLEVEAGDLLVEVLGQAMDVFLQELRLCRRSIWTGVCFVNELDITKLG